MVERLTDIDLAAEGVAEQIAQYRVEQLELGSKEVILPPELYAAYEGLSDAVRKKLAERNLSPASRTTGEVHIRELQLSEGGDNNG